jgi:hypothetical protein
MDRRLALGPVAQPDGMAEFSSGQFRRGKAIRFGATIAALGLLLSSMVRGPRNSVVDAYIIIVVAGIALLTVGLVRAFATGIYVGDGGVVAKTTYSTKHWTWETLERAGSLDSVSRGGPLYLGNSFSRGNERMRVVPVLYLTNGIDNRLYGLRIMSTSPYDSQWIDNAITEINGRIERRHNANG